MIISKPNQALLVPSGGPADALFPDAKRIDNLLVVPHGVRESMLLTRLGVKVPSPMLTYYDWAGGKPFAVQRSTCAMLTNNTHAYVLNDMGTGKTKAALWAWDYLNNVRYAKKALVVAPLSTLNFVWAREAFATLPHRKVAILHGSKKRRLELLADPAIDIFVINHDGVGVIAEALAVRDDIDALILDELAVYRNNNDRSKLMRKMAKKFTWVWGMTGRPMPNEPPDVWGQAMIVTPHTVPKYRSHCRDMLMWRRSQFLYIPKDDAVEQAFGMLQPAVRYSLDDVTELPEIVYRTIDVDLTPEQKKAYTTLAREFHVMVQNKQITAVNAAVAMGKLLQVAIGYVYTGDKAFGAIEFDSSPRKDALLEIISEVNRKVILMVPFRHAITGLSKLLTAEKIDHAIVHGDVAQGDRDQIFNLFQNTDKYKVLLAHPQVCSHGLTLTAADTIIWYCPIASLELYEQANARIHRVGQKHRQQILHFQATPVEKRIYSLLQKKQKVQDQLLQMFEDATGTIT